MLPIIQQVGGGVLIGWFGHILVCRQEVRSRRRVFRDLIRVHIDKFELVDAKRVRVGDLFKLYQDSMPTISDESLKILEDIPKRRRTNLKATRKAYISLTLGDVETYRGQDANMAEPILVHHNIEAGRTNLVKLLEDMIRYAK